MTGLTVMAEVHALHRDGRGARAAVHCTMSSEASFQNGAVEPVNRYGLAAVVRLTSLPEAFWCASGVAVFKNVLNELAGRADVTSIVLHGDTVFADALHPDMEAASSIIAAVADCPVAVFAAVEGNAVGVGLELALACKGRVAKDASTFALPAVLSGGLPIFGGIERLQALVDTKTAAQLIVFGETIDAGAALHAGLIDGMVARGVVRFAVALSQSPVRGVGRLTPRLHSISAELPSVRYEIASRLQGQAAPLAAVQAMEAVFRLPLRRASLEISKIAARLSNTDEAHALEHASRSERLLQRLGDVQSAALTELAARLAWPMRRAAIHLLDEGGSPAQVDRCLKTYGFMKLPFEEADRIGLAKVFSTNGRDIAADEAWLKYSPTLDFMVDGGRKGGSHPGWFRRKEGEALQFDPEVERILATSALFQRLQRARKPDEVFEGRLFSEMIVGSIELMTAHPELCWVDVDALWTACLGFPRWRGGPLFEGARSGWGKVRLALEAQKGRQNTQHVCEVLKRWETGEGAPARGAAKPEVSNVGMPFRASRVLAQ